MGLTLESIALIFCGLQVEHAPRAWIRRRAPPPVLWDCLAAQERRTTKSPKSRPEELPAILPIESEFSEGSALPQACRRRESPQSNQRRIAGRFPCLD